MIIKFKPLEVVQISCPRFFNLEFFEKDKKKFFSIGIIANSEIEILFLLLNCNSKIYECQVIETFGSYSISNTLIS